MFGLGAATRIYLAPGATDMRKGFNGLYGLVRDQLLCDPFEKGRFHWPKAGGTQGKIVLSHEEFAMLLGGIDLAQTQRRRWYRKPVVEESGSSQIPA